MSKPFPVPIAMFMPEVAPTRNQRLLAIFTRVAMNLSLVGIILAFLYGAYIFFWPIKTIVFSQLPFPVEVANVRRGEVIPLKIAFCKFNDATEKIVGQIVTDDADKLVLTMGEKQRHLESGCHTIHTRIWPIPAEARPGRYVAEFSITYLLFNVRSITVHSYSQPFQVVE